jgi:hypothetical protein
MQNKLNREDLLSYYKDDLLDFEDRAVSSVKDLVESRISTFYVLESFRHFATEEWVFTFEYFLDAESECTGNVEQDCKSVYRCELSISLPKDFILCEDVGDPISFDIMLQGQDWRDKKTFDVLSDMVKDSNNVIRSHLFWYFEENIGEHLAIAKERVFGFIQQQWDKFWDTKLQNTEESFDLQLQGFVSRLSRLYAIYMDCQSLVPKGRGSYEEQVLQLNEYFMKLFTGVDGADHLAREKAFIELLKDRVNQDNMLSIHSDDFVLVADLLGEVEHRNCVPICHLLHLFLCMKFDTRHDLKESCASYDDRYFDVIHFLTNTRNDSLSEDIIVKDSEELIFLLQDNIGSCESLLQDVSRTLGILDDIEGLVQDSDDEKLTAFICNWELCDD